VKPYYEHGGITIYHGDCREVLPELPVVPSLVVADPPFSIPVKYQDSKGTYPRSWGDLAVMEPFFREVFSALRAAVTDLAQVYICCDAESYPVFFKCGYPLWPQSQMIVWYKPTGRRGRGWLHSYELLLHLRTPTTEYTEGFRQDVIGIMPVRTLQRQHPAEKPADLYTHLAEGAPRPLTLLDPFCGAGSSLAWARARDHRAVGVEIEERWCEIAAKRLEQEVLDFGATV